MIGPKPPNKIHKMRPRNFRNAMPGEGGEVEIFHALAIDVDVIISSKPRSPFRYAAFSSVALINKRGDNREDRFRASHQFQCVTFIVSHQRCRTKSDQIRDQPTRPGCSRNRFHTLCTAAGFSIRAERTRSVLNAASTSARNSPASHWANGNEKVRFGRSAISRYVFSGITLRIESSSNFLCCIRNAPGIAKTYSTSL